MKLHCALEEDAALICELLDEYLPELAGHREGASRAVDGASYSYLPLYWTEPGRHAFTIVVEGQLAGCVLVRQMEPGSAMPRISHQIAEFYVRAKFRRSGVGRAVAGEVWQRFPGAWELQVDCRNVAADAFWRSCIEQFADAPVEARAIDEEDGRRVQYSFSVGLLAQQDG